jgi:hypothetical protein
MYFAVTRQKDSSSKREVQELRRPETATTCVILRLSEAEEKPAPKFQAVDNNTLVNKADGSKHQFSAVLDSRAGLSDSKKNQQRSLFEHIKPSIEKLFFGKSSVLFSAGSIRSGKSYALQGTNEHPGIIPQAVEQFFVQMER